MINAFALWIGYFVILCSSIIAVGAFAQYVYNYAWGKFILGKELRNVIKAYKEKKDE